MKKLRFILLSIVVLLVSGRAEAYDFESGGLYYNILDADAKTVEVTCENYTDWDTKANYSGDIVVPATVSNGGITYSVIKIGQLAFKGSEITSLTLSEGIETIEQDICEGCYSLASLSLPSTLRTIGYAAFWNCDALRTIDLPEGLTTLGNNVFSYCNSIKTVYLPSTLSSIGDGSFTGTTSLLSVISRISVPFEVNMNVFAQSQWNNETQSNTYIPCSATLYVPVGTTSKYQAFEGWKMFSDIVEGEPKETTVNGLNYSYVDGRGTATVIGRADEELRNITIPATVSIDGKKYNVKEVGVGAFQSCGIDTLIIQEGVEVISKNAFRNNQGNLRSVTLPTSLRTIGEGAFYNCYGIRNLIIPNGVTSIGKEAFRECYNIQKLELPATLTSIGEYAFYPTRDLSVVTSRITNPFEIGQSVFCTGWTWENDNQLFTRSSATLYVPDGSKSAYQAIDGWNMFADIIEGELKETTVNGLNYSYVDGNGTATVIGRADEELRNITIPATVSIDGNKYNVKEVGVGAFQSCYIDTLIIQEGVEIISRNAFRYNYGNLRSVTLPTSLRTIGEGAFYYCYGIRSLIIPNGVTSIGKEAFRECYNIQKLELPVTLTSIGEYAFSRINNLSTVTSRIQNPFAISQNVFCTDWTWENDKQIFTKSSAILYVPSGTKSAYQTIDGWNMFADVMEGEPQEGTGNDGFNYSYSTESKEAILIRGNYNDLPIEFNVPSTTTIGGTVYKVVGIAAEVFSNRDFTSVVIPNGVRSIGRYAFGYCQQMTSLSLPESLTRIDREAFVNCHKLTSLSIPAKVEAIGDYAFGLCSSLVSIKVDAANAYYDSRNNCNALIETATNKLLQGTPSTIIPTGVVMIGSQSFSNQKSLTGITIPGSVTTIGYDAFSDCDALTSVYIPSSVTRIWSGAFSWCDGITSVKVDPNNTVYDSRNDCNAIIETESNRLIFGCQTTKIPHGIKILGDGAFRGCAKLDSLKLPYGVERLEWGALSYNDLSYVEIPNSVTYMEDYIFDGCSNLMKIVSKIKNPSAVKTYSNTFYGEFWNNNGAYTRLVERATLYVPKGTKELYAQTAPWSNFTNIEEMDGEQLPTPTLEYDGRYVTASSTDPEVDMYYGIGGAAPSVYYEGPIPVTALGQVSVVAEKSFASDSEIATYEVKYLYTGDTLKVSEAGNMADAIKWCGADRVEKMTVVGPINSSEFETIRTMQNLKLLNLAEATGQLSIPNNAFASSNLVSFVAPASLSSVGSGIFSNCQQLAAVCWNTSAALPADALNGVNNPNLLLYVQNASDAPTSVHNVVVNGTANDIALSDATGNNNFYVPVAFTAKKISYTRNFQQKTEVGVSCGWETIALPFNVGSIVSEKLGSDYTLTPFYNYRNYSRQRPFWLYTLDEYNDNYISPASNISANVPYLICMPNADVYADDYNLNGNITFSAENVNVAVSDPIQKTKGSVSFVPAYQRMDASSDVFALNVNQEYKGYPAGSLFVNNFREVRPFEAYSLHPSTAANAPAIAYTVSCLIGGNGGDTTGIIDVMLKKNDGSDGNTLVKVYSLSGALIKQAKVGDVTKGLPKGVYIANGKKFVVK